MKRCIRAARAATMTETGSVISDFAMIVEDGVVLSCGKWSEIKGCCPSEVEDLGNVTIVPGLINAHAHLGLSHLQGMTVQGGGFTPWVQSLLASPLRELDRNSVAEAAQEMVDTGTAYVADISTTDTLKVAESLSETGLGFTAFCECMGQTLPKQGRRVFPKFSSAKGRIAGAGHALYSTHTDMLQAVKAADSAAGFPFSIHLAENEEEDLILAGEKCAFAEMLEGADLLSKFPGSVRPVPYADSLGLLDSQTLAVHCVQVDGRDIDILKKRGTSVCLCPRSNEYIGEGRAPWEDIISAGINTCLGTDSIASNHDLNLWNEFEYLLEHIDIFLDPVQALALVTANPARALGITGHYGSLEPGSQAAYAVMPREIENRLF